MHHKCVKCGMVYEHACEEILNGCICGSKLFYFVKGNAATPKRIDEDYVPQAEEIEYFYELEDDENQELIAFDVEAVRVKSSGKYELDIASLMRNDGLVYQYSEGKYGIDIDANMKQLRRKR